ncbi:hypothetical protein QTI66_04185 [Variovorax sp. J22R133]|uniref:hypothetical protein n=1 Tax=Variovorax brevis TaxID=3053503 RepID=UPI00257823A8|nr:hypothetical protein [Variovorax sp. J22R133]MDM0111333.1 hypothetical protein [Variovorax sp. J22R133]
MHCIQELDTSGARAVETFVHAGERYLVVPQLAYDVPGQPALMTLGNSATDALVYRWDGGRFVEHARLDVPGGEDAEYFRIGQRGFLATASLRTGQNPYDLNVSSTIFEIVDGRFEAFQKLQGFAAKQWKHFSFDGRHFLAFAQNVSMPDETPAQPADSCIFEWNGERFVPFQTVRSAWGYNWAFMEVGGEKLLAYADHAVPSQILRWNGDNFEPFQELEGKTGRAFCFFEAEGESWLAFANLHHDTLLYQWQGGRFVVHQTLSGPGGREFEWIATAQGGRLVQVNFLHGTREQPIPGLDSVIYRMEGGRMQVDQAFSTSGGTDACAFEDNGRHYLVVANSLSGAVRFRTPSRVYRLDDEGMKGAS